MFAWQVPQEKLFASGSSVALGKMTTEKRSLKLFIHIFAKMTDSADPIANPIANPTTWNNKFLSDLKTTFVIAILYNVPKVNLWIFPPYIKKIIYHVNSLLNRNISVQALDIWGDKHSFVVQHCF